MVWRDVRDLTQIQHLAQLETLVALLNAGPANQLIYINLARDVRVSVDTARRWIDTLRSLHLGFLIRPWFKNVSRPLRKKNLNGSFEIGRVLMTRETGRRPSSRVICSRPLKGGMIWGSAISSWAIFVTRISVKWVSLSSYSSQRMGPCVPANPEWAETTPAIWRWRAL